MLRLPRASLSAFRSAHVVQVCPRFAGGGPRASLSAHLVRPGPLCASLSAPGLSAHLVQVCLRPGPLCASLSAHGCVRARMPCVRLEVRLEGSMRVVENDASEQLPAALSRPLTDVCQ